VPWGALIGRRMAVVSAGVPITMSLEDVVFLVWTYLDLGGVGLALGGCWIWVWVKALRDLALCQQR
jgi:hypothetical protein